MMRLKKFINFLLDILAFPWLLVLVLDARAKRMLRKWQKIL